MIYLHDFYTPILSPAVESTVTFNNSAFNSEAMINIFPSILSPLLRLCIRLLNSTRNLVLGEFAVFFLFMLAITFRPTMNISFFFGASVVSLFWKRAPSVPRSRFVFGCRKG